MTMASTRISVIGLGKLGSPIAAAFASRGFTVVGVDSDPAKVQAINDRQPPIFEPGLAELLQQTEGRFTATTDLAAAILATDLTSIIVPTPSNADGTFSLDYAMPVCEAIGRALAAKDRYHVVVMTSTVMPGHTDGPIREALEKHSGKRVGQDFGLCYSPEFVALGSVIHDFLHPDMVLIGESDPRAGDMLEAVTTSAALTKPSVARLSFPNAELAKIAVNTYVTTKITYANMLAAICQAMPGGDVDQVTQAIGLDSRIGRKYLCGAIGYGGPCFPRDNVALAALARQLGAQAELAQAVDSVNRRTVDRLANLVLSQHQPGQTVAVLGLSYKPHTDVTEQSQGLMLAEALINRGLRVVAYDPKATESARRTLNGGARYATQLSEAMDANLFVVTTPWPEIESDLPKLLARRGGGATVIDCWRCIAPARLAGVADLIAVGIGPCAAESRAVQQRVA